MKNEINRLDGMQIEFLIQEELLRVLECVPILNDVQVFTSQHQAYDIQAIANVNDVRSLRIICEVKSNGEPKYIRKAAAQLLSLKEQMQVNNEDEKPYYLLAAPYISPASSKICEEFGMGFIDLSGNCLIIYDGIYIRVEGKPNKYRESKGKNTSIFERRAVKSSVILRQLLQTPNRRWKMKELSDYSKSSIGQVANIKRYLEEKEYIASDEDGFFVAKPKEIITEWAQIYNSKPNMTYEYYTKYSVQEFEQKLIQLKEKTGIEYAVTGFSGAVRYSPTVRYNKVHVYIPYQDLQEAVLSLDCKQVTSGSNVSIIVPYDPCTMLNVRNINQLIVASPIQVCLDLLALKGRGEEAANAIMEREF
ncbi:type IV toxin-antitoxin system AbiEi family antitoxin [Megasphaera paucivorans]|uniref:Transcriptional regulator, AbiEi antitoxin, Type IV TA system n=1 Tax=Megasphaera paucivorans TaxID=349095 RepID=A0A1G9UDS7_9FIRM|nr:type IV toxin-antitoxin system AbiEi family antitoxin [Megasphaera paucivorans]SDM57854.1 Transcriptional regulator, AbiEi antitoxin, Type IV TA system [Megasphaera paucivorans]